MANQFGYKDYLIIGEQSDWDVALSSITDSAIIQTIYEVRDARPRKIFDHSPAQRLKRIGGQPLPVKGRYHAELDLSTFLHTENMLAWFKHLLHDNALASVDFTAQEVFGDGLGGSKAVASTTISLDTQPTATSPASDPGKLIFTFDAAKTLTATITGTDGNDEVISEVLTFSSDTTKTTTKYFKSVNASGIVFSVNPSENLLITADKNTWTHTIEPKDVLLEGLTMEIVLGAIPNTFVGMLVNSGVISVGNGGIGFDLSLIGKDWVEGENVAGGTTPSSTAGWTFPESGRWSSAMNENIYGDWTMALSIDSTQIKAANTQITYSNQLTFPSRPKFSGIRTKNKPVHPGDQSLVLNASVDFDTVANGIPDFESYVRNLTEITCDWVALYTPNAGPEYSITISMPRAVVMAREVDNNRADILQSLTIQALISQAAATRDDFTITVVTTESGV